MAEMRQAVLAELGYTCSAGIAPNKVRQAGREAGKKSQEVDDEAPLSPATSAVTLWCFWVVMSMYMCVAGVQLLSKLASGMNKPAAQTLVLPERVRDLLGPLPISRIKGLGGDLGARIQVRAYPPNGYLLGHCMSDACWNAVWLLLCCARCRRSAACRRCRSCGPCP